LRNELDPVLQSIGKYGCTWLSLLEGNIDPTLETLAELHTRHTLNGWLGTDCVVLNDVAILHDLTGYGWTATAIPRAVLPPPTGDKVLYKLHGYSGDGYHWKTPDVDTEVEKPRILAGYVVYTRIV
jgi:hypothetical protein